MIWHTQGSANLFTWSWQIRDKNNDVSAAKFRLHHSWHKMYTLMKMLLVQKKVLSFLHHITLKVINHISKQLCRGFSSKVMLTGWDTKTAGQFQCNARHWQRVSAFISIGLLYWVSKLLWECDRNVTCQTLPAKSRPNQTQIKGIVVMSSLDVGHVICNGAYSYHDDDACWMLDMLYLGSRSFSQMHLFLQCSLNSACLIGCVCSAACL